LLVGGLVAWLGQGRHRRLEKRFAADAATWRKEAEAQKNRADALAAQNAGGIAAIAIAGAGRNAA
jgi:hypothetical protein